MKMFLEKNNGLNAKLVTYTIYLLGSTLILIILYFMKIFQEGNTGFFGPEIIVTNYNLSLIIFVIFELILGFFIGKYINKNARIFDLCIILYGVDILVSLLVMVVGSYFGAGFLFWAKLKLIISRKNIFSYMLLFHIPYIIGAFIRKGTDENKNKIE